MHQSGLIKAIKLIGSQSQLARKIGISRQRLNHWLNRNQTIPYHYALAIIHVTKGAISLEELCERKKPVFEKDNHEGVSSNSSDLLIYIKAIHEDIKQQNNQIMYFLHEEIREIIYSCLYEKLAEEKELNTKNKFVKSLEEWI